MTVLKVQGQLVISPEEKAASTLFIKSDCWPDPPDDPNATRFVWIARHPGSGWSAEGDGSSHLDCVSQINDLLLQLGEDGDVDVRPGRTIMRTFHGENVTGIGSIRHNPH